MTDSPTSANSSATARPGAGRKKPGAGRKKPNVVAGFLSGHWLPLVLAVIVAFFIGQNRERISINLFWAHLKAPLWFVLVITAVVGIIIGVLAARRRAHRAQPAQPARER